MEPLITFSRVCMHFSTRSVITNALADIDASFARGSTTAIVGANASGKSTMLRIAAGVLAPSTGRVESIAVHSALKRAFVPQRGSCAADFSVEELVSLGTSTRCAEQARVECALDAVGLASRRAVRYHSLSGGEQQRVRVARAIAQIASPNGSVLLLDEPFSSLDPAEVARLVRALRVFAQEGGSVILSLHDAGLAREVAHDAIALRMGRVIAHGRAHEVLSPAILSEVYAHEMLEASTTARWLRPTL